MKKTLISSSMLAILCASTSANAAFVDASGGSFNGNINFGGTVVDASPIWAFEIPASTVSGVQNWHSLAQANGQVAGSNTEFNFNKKPTLTLIQGFMKTTATSGGPGLTPVINVGPDGSALRLNGDNQSLNIVAVGTTTNGSVNGTLSFDIKGFIGGAYLDGATPKYFGAVEAQQLLASNRADFASEYPAVQANTTNFSDSNAVFADINAKSLSGAYKVDMSNYKLSFPSNDMPETWTAAVPVTVTLK